jgi:predicted flavoprotein YhiN
VPLTFADALLDLDAPALRVALEAVARCGKAAFREAMLFTHRGLSGPAVLQASSYWREGEAITLDLARGATRPRRCWRRSGRGRARSPAPCWRSCCRRGWPMRWPAATCRRASSGRRATRR